MHVEASNAAGRSRAVRALGLLLGLLPCLGCENVPPYFQRSYVRLEGQALVEHLNADGDTANGPYPGLGLTGGTLLEVEKTHASALEAEVQLYDINSSDLDGYGFLYSTGWRRFWNMDGRYRPNFGVGGEWTDFHLDDHDRSFDPTGPGAYADFGIDWMMTPIYAVGLRLRGHLRYEEADHDNGIKPAIELALHSAWRF